MKRIGTSLDLWLKNVDDPVDGKNLIEFRFRRVPFGVVSSPLLLAAVIKHHLQSVPSNVARELERNLYVDNAIIEAEIPEEAKSKYKEVKEIFKTAQMNMREFLSNSIEFNKSIPESDQATVPSQRGNDPKSRTVSYINRNSCNAIHQQAVGFARYSGIFVDRLYVCAEVDS
ncbi:unnamed protein product [Gongylonema pulchrum]|uniref:Reverse transcriptase domain-containing protein n=1 Tax=Gongylonema pulchrum TaxID=637853 RepID=A0A183DWC5_9BILA|nr:unnamed protein product [Gongylonema pulchrum]